MVLLTDSKLYFEFYFLQLNGLGSGPKTPRKRVEGTTMSPVNT